MKLIAAVLRVVSEPVVVRQNSATVTQFDSIYPAVVVGQRCGCSVAPRPAPIERVGDNNASYLRRGSHKCAKVVWFDLPQCRLDNSELFLRNTQRPVN